MHDKEKMIKINDSWIDAVKKIFIEKMKQKKKNGEKFTEDDKEMANFFQLPLDKL